MARMLPHHYRGLAGRLSLIALMLCSVARLTASESTREDHPAYTARIDFHESAHGSRPMMRRVPPVAGEALRQMRPLPPVEGAAPAHKQPVEPQRLRRLPPVSLRQEAADEASLPATARWSASEAAFESVQRQADAAIRQGYALAERGALYSARAEFVEALRGVAGALDAHYGGSQHSQALLRALQALKEAGDFTASGERLETEVDVAGAVAVHRTPVLRDQPLDGMSRVLAMQRYHLYAQEQFVLASGGAPPAAEALYGLGKVHMAFGEPSQAAERMYGPKSITYFSSAVAVDPAHALAANELGVLYARFGNWQEARQALQRSVAIRPMPESWQNLAEVHQQLGEVQLAELARREAQRVQGPVQAAATAMVRWVEPHVFATSNSAEANAPRGGADASAATPRTATQSKWKWW